MAPMRRREQTSLHLLTAVAGLGAALAVRSALDRGYQRKTGRSPPKNPADPTVPWRSALLWSVSVGALVGVAKTAARKGATAGWQRLR